MVKITRFALLLSVLAIAPQALSQGVLDGTGNHPPRVFDGTGNHPPRIFDGTGNHPPRIFDGTGNHPPR